MSVVHIAFVFAFFFTVDGWLWWNKESSRRVGVNFDGAPVVFIPGDAATPMDARVDREIAKDNCADQEGWYRLWLNLRDALTGQLYCTVENMRLIFDPSTKTSHNPPGIETRSPGWGTTEVIEYLDDSFFARLFHIGDDALQLVKVMVEWGYERDVSIRGATYDFRYAMASQPELFTRIRLLVEETSRMNNNRRVSLMSHSFGGLYATWFLNHQPQSWKDEYIQSFIPISTPWGGSMLALKAITSGYNYNIALINRFLTRKLQRSIESNYMLIPDYRFHEPGNIFIYTKTRNYTLTPSDIDAYFENANNPTGRQMYDVIKDQNWPKGNELLPPHPGVETYCLYGTGFDTVKSLHYADAFPDGKPTLEYTAGDETVSRVSLSGCKAWVRSSSEQGSRALTEVHEYPGVSHLGIFDDPDTQKKIKSILFGHK